MSEKSPPIEQAAHQGNQPPAYSAQLPRQDAPASRDPDKCRGLTEAYLLGLILGWMGAHHFYLRRPGWGCLYLFTFGLLGVGYVVDIFRMPWLVRKVRKEEREKNNPNWIQLQSTGEAYLLWMPFGLLGAHHFYLKNLGWGFVYFFTFGFLGIGWIIDLFAIPFMVKEHNARQKAVHAIRQGAPPRPSGEADPHDVISAKSMITAYKLCLFPFTGVLGFHHYYMGRIAYGLFYTFTLGGLGVPWIADCFRLPILIKDANKRRRENRGFRERRLDDCYLMAIPFGILGAHHFYLRRVGWGFLYFFTLGCFGIGWLVDLIRMPCLVRRHKEEMQNNLFGNQGSEIGGPGAVVNVQVATPGGPVIASQHIQTLGPGIYVVSPGHVTATGGQVVQVLPSYPQVTGQMGNATGLPPGYPVKANGVEGMPPDNLPPPGYDEAAMSSFSTIDSSNVDGPPSYQNLVSQAAVHGVPSAPEEPK